MYCDIFGFRGIFSGSSRQNFYSRDFLVLFSKKRTREQASACRRFPGCVSGSSHNPAYQRAILSSCFFLVTVLPAAADRNIKFNFIAAALEILPKRNFRFNRDRDLLFNCPRQKPAGLLLFPLFLFCSPKKGTKKGRAGSNFRIRPRMPALPRPRIRKFTLSGEPTRNT